MKDTFNNRLLFGIGTTLGVVALLCSLSACGPMEKRDPYIEREFEVDGCVVKYVNHQSLPNFYIARCDNTTTTTWRQQQGKSSVTRATVNVESADDLRKQLAEVEARDKALAKLSADDKKALGIK